MRTLFNLLGPIVNPAGADYQLIGVYDVSLTRVLAEALAELGSRGALVVHCAGVDEIGLHDVTVGHRLRDHRIEPFSLDPRDHGLALQPLEALRGGDAQDNAAALGLVLSGERGARADVVALNAAAALEVAGVVPDLDQGLELARARLADGRALDVLERYVAVTRQENTREAG